MAKKLKLPIDTNERAKSIVDIATGDNEDKTINTDEINADAATLRRKAGLKGGNARAKSLSAKRRTEIAKKAANTRWSI